MKKTVTADAPPAGAAPVHPAGGTTGLLPDNSQAETDGYGCAAAGELPCRRHGVLLPCRRPMANLPASYHDSHTHTHTHSHTHTHIALLPFPHSLKHKSLSFHSPTHSHTHRSPSTPPLTHTHIAPPPLPTHSLTHRSPSTPHSLTHTSLSLHSPLPLSLNAMPEPGENKASFDF